jgi:hypothetical protein
MFFLEWYKSQALVVRRKEFGLEANTDRTKYMVMSRDQHTVQNY